MLRNIRYLVFAICVALLVAALNVNAVMIPDDGDSWTETLDSWANLRPSGGTFDFSLSTDRQEGSYSIKASNPTSTGIGPQRNFSPTLDLTSFTRVVFWAKQENLTIPTDNIKVLMYSGVGETYYKDITVTSSWQQFSIDFSSMKKRGLDFTNVMLIYFSFKEGGTGKALYIDGLRFENDMVRLVDGGTSDYTIVEPDNPVAVEHFAAQELASFIESYSGATLSIVEESSFSSGNAIYVGQTQYAANAGINFSQLGQEEWDLRMVNNDLVLSGGRPRGTLYGVYEFLETIVGIRFLDPDTTYMPSNPNGVLDVPDDLSVNREPAFRRRDLYTVVKGGANWARFRTFFIRRKLNAFANATQSIDGSLGFSFRYGSPSPVHGQAFYVSQNSTLFNDPSYFAVTSTGGSTYPGGQVCMSNSTVRSIFAGLLRDYIDADRAAIDTAGTGEPYPTMYSVCPEDGGEGQCYCTSCVAKAATYGSYAGVVLEFVNYLANDIAQDYPEITLTTLAYGYYLDPPSNIQPVSNVMIRMAHGQKSDRFRSINHTVNSVPKQRWTDWSAICGDMGIHDYWTYPAVCDNYAWPYAFINDLADSIKSYYNFGVKDYFAEANFLGSRIHNFVDLQLYMASKLLDDPTLDTSTIINDFMELYYGAASQKMKDLLTYIEQRQDEESAWLQQMSPWIRTYLDADFFINTDSILTQAEGLVTYGSQTYDNIRQERMTLDESMLYPWLILEQEGGSNWNFVRTQVLARLEDNYEAAYDKYGGWGAAYEALDQARLDYLSQTPSLPSQFAGSYFIDVVGPMLQLTRAGVEPISPVDDNDAYFGKAWRLDSSLPDPAGDFSDPPQFGLYDFTTVPNLVITQTLTGNDIPQDEQYHWYFAGQAKLTQSLYVWAHNYEDLSLRLAWDNLNVAYNYSVSPSEQKTYDYYISLKLTGPAYVSGSNSADSFSIDRIFLVENNTFVEITSPEDNDTVSGTISIQGAASEDDVIEIQIDSGSFVQVSGTGNWTYSLDTSTLSNGSHTVTSRATDHTENTATDTISINVSN